ncbi:MAG: hypothetical protein GX446_19035 [Chthonomonadales bacterium]|nr:hypothetical protein [Chthonomonadales bacterium]
MAAVGTTTVPHSSVDGTSIRDPARLGAAIRALLRGMRSRASSASVVLLPSASAMRSFRMPDAPAREQRLLVRGELEQTGALPIGAGVFGFLWLPAPTEDDRKEADVFAFYADDALVDGVREALRVANLRLDAIEPYSVATMRAFLVSRPDSGPVAMLCPWEDHTDLCIHDGEQVRYMRRIPGGWDEIRYLRSAVAQSAGDGVKPLGVSDAGQPVGFAPVPLGSDASSSSANFLAAEVARSFAFYSREYKDSDVPRALVILSPRTFAGPIASAIEGVVPIPVVTDDPAVWLDVPEPSEGEQGALGYLAAAGVGLGDVGQILPRVDTSRQEAAAIKRRQAPNVLLMGMAASTVWMLLVVVASVALAFMQMSAEGERIRLKVAIDAEWAKREAPLRSQELFAAARRAQLKVALPAPTVLGSIAQAYIDSLSIRTIKIETGGKVTIEGDAASPESMQMFAANLAKTPGVHSPTFDMMHQDENGNLSFRIIGSCADLSPEGMPKSGQE